MSGISLDLGGVARPKWEPLPEQLYTLVLSDLVVKAGKSDSTKQIAHCVYEVVEPAEFEGRKVLHWQQLNPDEKDKGYLKVWVEALLGEPVDDSISLDEDMLVGKHVTAFVVQVPDNRDSTKTQNKISYFELPFDTDES